MDQTRSVTVEHDCRNTSPLQANLLTTSSLGDAPISHSTSGQYVAPTGQDVEGDSLDDTYLTFDEFAQNVLATTSARQLPQLNTSYAWSQLGYTTPSVVEQHSPFPSSIDVLNSPNTTVPPVFQINRITERSVDLFFKHTYPIYPVIEESSIRSILSGSREPTLAESCLLWSICALTLVTVDSWPAMTVESRSVTARKYVRQCLDTRMANNFIESASIEDVLASLFIAVTYFDLKCRKTSWFHLKEAITLGHFVGITCAGQNSLLDSMQKIIYQRVYALLYITERGACIHDKFPVSILEPPDLPYVALPGEERTVSPSLSGLFQLFSLLDMSFIQAWTESSLSPNTATKLEELQQHLRRPISVEGMSDIQRANILVTQQWLRLMVWQTALRLGLVSSTTVNPTFSYTYPVEIATSLCEILKTLAPISIQVHGLGIFEKQFEIAYSLLDALTLSTVSLPGDHHETLRSLLLSLSASPTSREIYVHILQKKIGQSSGKTVDQKYVHLADVQLLREDRNSRQNTRRSSAMYQGGLEQ
ncbi:hypothetical protein AUEXF2481DRAFT_3861 [Aureobasidium subglaciale EXF-2481]|uniref:Xylanolytic transcriptional activator regulatory domain-containing protein n=1 Tax=Aureobasidium subglaciale (strain EXF-2481) TaxID=1043005 RepID=A0A074YJU2_AURSE|nr:uncharacterized protein AUEXF2481DRAFT_3861 [Aureobasidium subglaciale EXF-2481]KAI5201292.1 hypothetical protein E4T38_06156 [Aureobasidium subglaciale]KAI5219861.1 hypothetical protein E4T40_06177 [Aureobasidium subglaciale]KAI5223634.1 hypothetical protein E4T41_06020 [Aureobasidium subglaciale]KAI5260576.1 hypothetical protein E4T46_05911 [Aureobasidium subglaciale]KEQ96344.1 hypothetical protein AUEXF2481DRAFT_3861 [Aureobasidium subglaciale EXF-2481]